MANEGGGGTGSWSAVEQQFSLLIQQLTERYENLIKMISDQGKADFIVIAGSEKKHRRSFVVDLAQFCETIADPESDAAKDVDILLMMIRRIEDLMEVDINARFEINDIGGAGDDMERKKARLASQAQMMIHGLFERFSARSWDYRKFVESKMKRIREEAKKIEYALRSLATRLSPVAQELNTMEDP